MGNLSLICRSEKGAALVQWFQAIGRRGVSTEMDPPPPPFPLLLGFVWLMLPTPLSKVTKEGGGPPSSPKGPGAKPGPNDFQGAVCFAEPPICRESAGLPIRTSSRAGGVSFVWFCFPSEGYPSS